MRIRKRPEALLPGEMPRHPLVLVNMVAGAGLDVPNQVRQSHAWPQANENVRVVRHAIDFDELLALASHDPGHVLVEFLLALGSDEVLSALHGKNHLDIDLRVSASHNANSI